MTTCSNKSRGCRIRRHPDRPDTWYCPQCGKKFIEDPGFPLIFLIVGMIASLIIFSGLLSSKNNPNTPSSSDQQSFQMQ